MRELAVLTVRVQFINVLVHAVDLVFSAFSCSGLQHLHYTQSLATNTDTSCSVYSPVDLDLFPLLKIGENDVQFEPEFRYI